MVEAAAPIIWIPGVGWDDMPGTDKRMVLALSKTRQVIWVDSSRRRVWAGWWRRQSPAVETAQSGITRLRAPGPPGFSRWPVRLLTAFLHRQTVVRNLDAQTPSAVVISNPVTRFPERLSAPRVLYVTDDWIAGASLIGHNESFMVKVLRANIAAADAVAGVTPEILDLLDSYGLDPEVPRAVIPNGAPMVTRHPEIARQRIAGVVGQLNERIDLTALEAVSEAGVPLRLIGPRADSSTEFGRRLDALLAKPGVEWTGALKLDDLALELAEIRVGLTPYVDTSFNRASFPLKTLEYLAAGAPAVSTNLSASRWLNSKHVTVTNSPDAFARAVLEAVTADGDPSLEDERVALAERHSWPHRAADFAELIEAAQERHSAAPGRILHQ